MICATCGGKEARHLARLGNDSWPVCDRCKAQGEDYSPRMIHTLLDRTEPAVARPPDTMWDEP